MVFQLWPLYIEILVLLSWIPASKEFSAQVFRKNSLIQSKIVDFFEKIQFLTRHFAIFPTVRKCYLKKKLLLFGRLLCGQKLNMCKKVTKFDKLQSFIIPLLQYTCVHKNWYFWHLLWYFLYLRIKVWCNRFQINHLNSDNDVLKYSMLFFVQNQRTGLRRPSHLNPTPPKWILFVLLFLNNEIFVKKENNWELFIKSEI